MKKTIIMIVVASLLTLTLASCFGSFALTRKVYEFNSGVGDSSLVGKFVNTLLMWGMYIIPIYPISATVDIIILNLIEFWTSSNPLAMNDSEMDIRYATIDGEQYEVVITKHRTDISRVGYPENMMSFLYDIQEDAWYLHSDGNVIKIVESDGIQTHFFDFDGSLIHTLASE
jgi:hypothetical protein